MEIRNPKQYIQPKDTKFFNDERGKKHVQPTKMVAPSKLPQKKLPEKDKK